MVKLKKRSRAGKNTLRGLLVLTVFSVGVPLAAAQLTPLDTYVATPDLNYSYSLYSVIPGAGYTAYVLRMTSQNWLTSWEVTRTKWDHWLTVIKPDTVTHDQAMLLIGGGSNGDPAPTASNQQLAILGAVSVLTNSVTAYLGMVPNQPLTFTGDYKPSRWEDSLIAWSWDKYMDGYAAGDANEDWPAQLPMTKSAVRAMDTIQSFIGGMGTTVNSFVVGGASKRGWTTWLTGAVDSRVLAIVPMVIDTLNVEQCFQHHYDVYGFWAPAVHDYVEMGIMDRLGTPEGVALMAIVDPYVYRDRLTMPKYMINSTGDEFFVPDSSQFYYDDLPGTKYLRYVPNTNHSLEQAQLDVTNSTAAFYAAILDDKVLPEFSWTVQPDGSIRVHIDSLASLRQVNLWRATNPTTRDFRYETIGAAWSKTALTDQGGGVYIGSVPASSEGWTAYMVEVIFDSGMGQGMEYKFTTQVKVLFATQFMAGDTDRDGDVDLVDLGALAGAYGTTSGATWAMGNFDGDYDVDLVDLGALAGNYGYGVPAPLDFAADAAKLGLGATRDVTADESSKESNDKDILSVPGGCSPIAVVFLAYLAGAFSLLGGAPKKPVTRETLFVRL
jgi:PhoPQ-activated pathogenicity-related protein